MNKRHFLKAFAAALVAAPAALKASAADTQRVVWGPMDVMRHREYTKQGIHLHVYHKGQDVSSRCRFFDDTPGRERAELYLRDANGRFYLCPDKSQAALEIVTDFEVRRGGPDPDMSDAAFHRVALEEALPG